MQETITDKVIKLESMKNMSIDQIVYLYKSGYIIDDSSQIERLPDSPATSARLIRYGFMDNSAPNYPIPPEIYERWNRQKRYGFTGNEALYFPNDPPWIYERESKYAFSGDVPIPPAIQERFERQRKYAFTGQESQSFQSLQGVSVSDGALLLIGIGVLAYLYIKK